MRLKSGFTLVELAIVIVVIGLLVGGVLQGQELIKEAKIRKVVIDLRSYTTSIATFKLKYGQIPGDFSEAKRFFSNCPLLSGVDYCNGNNSGIINHIEGVYFWKHLEMAGLVKGSFSVTQSADAFPNIYNEKYMLITGFFNTSLFAFNEDFEPDLGQEGGYLGINRLLTIFKPQLTGNASDFTEAEDCEFIYKVDSKIDDSKPHTGILMDASKGFLSIYPNAYWRNCSAEGSNASTNNNYLFQDNPAIPFSVMYHFE